MALLNQLFNRGLIGQRGKTCLTLAISRIKLLQNKRDGQLRLMRKEIAQFLQAGQEPIAQIRVEHVIREQNIWAAYEILEMFCEFLLARIPILDSQRECPTELREAVASIIFAASRCSDIPELLHVRNSFGAKYGKEFISAASELRPDTSVNRTIIEKLSVSAPSTEVRLQVLKDIAQEYNVQWDSSKTEAEFSKKPEDLLNGPKQIVPPSWVASKHDSHKPPPTMDHSTTSISSSHESKGCQSSTPIIHPPMTAYTGKPSVEDRKSTANIGTNDTRPVSSDALEKARAAIAAAERASAAARLAADLVKLKSSSVNLDQAKS